MSNGESTISMLRYFYPSDIVIADSKQYYFFQSTIFWKNNYLDENFKLNEENELEYFEEENIISQKGIEVTKYQGKMYCFFGKNERSKLPTDDLW